jgi:hypothetical protein
VQVVHPHEFLLYNGIAELVVGDDFFKLAMGHFDKKFDLLMIGGIVIHNLASHHGSPEFASIVHVANEGETKKFVRTEVRKLEIWGINIQARKIGCREEDGIGWIPRPRRNTEVGVVGIMPFAAGNELCRIVSEDLIGEGDALGFGNTNPTTGFLATLGGKRMGFISIEDWFVPVKVQEWRNIRALARSLFDRGETVEGSGGKMIHEEDNIEKAEEP